MFKILSQLPPPPPRLPPASFAVASPVTEGVGWRGGGDLLCSLLCSRLGNIRTADRGQVGGLVLVPFSI